MNRPTWEDLAPRLEELFIGQGAHSVPDDVYRAAWDLMADYVEASLSDAQRQLQLLEREFALADKWSELEQHPLRWVESVVRETRRQAERNGTDSLLRDTPPPLPEDRAPDPEAEGWSVAWGQVEDPGRLVYIYTPQTSGWGYGPEYDRAERFINDGETWGQALGRMEAWAERWREEHGATIKEAIEQDRRLAELLLFKSNILEDVIRDFVRYGHVERRIGPTEEHAALTPVRYGPGGKPGHKHNADAIVAKWDELMRRDLRPKEAEDELEAWYEAGAGGSISRSVYRKYISEANRQTER